MATTEVNDLPNDSAIGGTEKILVVDPADSDLGKTITVENLETHILTGVPTENTQLSQADIANFGFTKNTGTVSSLADLSISATATEINELDGVTGLSASLSKADSALQIGDVTITGSGNAITNIEKTDDDTITVTKGTITSGESFNPATSRTITGDYTFTGTTNVNGVVHAPGVVVSINPTGDNLVTLSTYDGGGGSANDNQWYWRTAQGTNTSVNPNAWSDLGAGNQIFFDTADDADSDALLAVLSDGDSVFVLTDTGSAEIEISGVVSGGSGDRRITIESIVRSYGTPGFSGGITISDEGLDVIGSPSVDFTEVTVSGIGGTSLPGLTATVDELNILDGVTATTAEINLLDGKTESDFGGSDIPFEGNGGTVELTADLTEGTHVTIRSNDFRGLWAALNTGTDINDAVINTIYTTGRVVTFSFASLTPYELASGTSVLFSGDSTTVQIRNTNFGWGAGTPVQNQELIWSYNDNSGVNLTSVKGGDGITLTTTPQGNVTVGISDTANQVVFGNNGQEVDPVARGGSSTRWPSSKLPAATMYNNVAQSLNEPLTLTALAEFDVTGALEIDNGESTITPTGTLLVNATEFDTNGGSSTAGQWYWREAQDTNTVLNPTAWTDFVAGNQIVLDTPTADDATVVSLQSAVDSSGTLYVSTATGSAEFSISGTVGSAANDFRFTISGLLRGYGTPGFSGALALSDVAIIEVVRTTTFRGMVDLTQATFTNLSTTNPGIAGRLYRLSNGNIRVSDG